MKILKLSKDGGPTSPVDAFFLVESKRWFTVALLRFNEGGREEYHTHAFNAYTWFLCGALTEEDEAGEPRYVYKRSVKPKYTPREKCHRVRAWRTSWCLTLRGPWADTWTELTADGQLTLFGWGRRVLFRSKV